MNIFQITSFLVQKQCFLCYAGKHWDFILAHNLSSNNFCFCGLLASTWDVSVLETDLNNQSSIQHGNKTGKIIDQQWVQDKENSDL